ncbi:Putative two-component membrane permease complex subunit [Sporomusa silvacetica DSM 10669]|uniref:Two-component membrane permease complex subunit n=1 Tax=Sporomusa silvacetica DSM 10669 TaxID=1123289 RepID=A0ABZ3IPQ8_9FIRM|nr:TIGR03943 family protein [Sporomusa silvacetica]OZC22262.1 putative two-component membrane permease complex subunit [Sporomusa silvacetica DSM 10669]
MRKRITFNSDAFVRSVILLGFALLFGYLMITGQITLYINPRFVSMAELAVYLLIPLLILQTVKIFDAHKPAESSGCCHSHSSRWIYLPFIATLLLAFLVPTNSLDAQLVANKGLNSKASSKAGPELSNIARPLAQELSQSKTIQVNDKNFAEVMSELQLFPADYIGKEITLTGFVFRSSGLMPNQLDLVRYVISCCAADARPFGVLCELKDADKYEDGKWLQIQGIVQMGKYEDQTVSMVKVVTAKEIKSPGDPYVFPLAQ